MDTAEIWKPQLWLGLRRRCAPRQWAQWQKVVKAAAEARQRLVAEEDKVERHWRLSPHLGEPSGVMRSDFGGLVA